MKIQLKFHLNILLILCKSCLCQFYDSLSIDYNKLSKYTLDTYDENDVVTRYHLNYNFHYYQFDEYNDMLFFTDIKYAIICHDEDIDKPDDEKETLLFWNTSIYKIFMSTTIYINAFPIWYIEQKQKGKIFCMRFDSVGWDKNGSEEICKNESLACPDLIILKTSQLTHRYFNGDTLNLNKYFRKYYKKNGKSFDSLLNKYSYYEYRINNNWLAVPLSEDFRIFQINITTFNDCISEGYDLHYPPPLSNYWGPNYKETWTWEKAFEYAGKIYNCTKKPGFKILNNYNEDVSFFSALCQSLNIPFITEDIDTNIKKCGLRKPEAIQKLSILKDLAENHYIEMWINKTTVKEWQNKKYPTNVEEQPLITYDNDYIFNDTSVNGMTFNTLFEMKLQSDLRYVYVPGSTSSLLGTGIIITKNSRFPDESFEFIEVLINENYTFYTELNVSKTPIENISGKRCIKNYETFKKTHCSSLIQSDGEYPYYYIRNNITTFIYLTHKNIGEERGISINVDTLTSSSIFDKETFRNKEFICDQQANFEESTITYQDDYKLVIPLSNNETILLKSTVDINNNSDQTIEMICSIYDETLKKSKPVQFPYYNFYEMDNVISKSPISLLFAHLYYKHNTTNEGSFERIVNECCDIIDNALIPYCQDIKDIKFSFNKCFNNNLTMPIVYSNCKIKENDNIPRYAECNYLPYSNYIGYVLIIISSLSNIIYLVFLFFILIHYNHKIIIISGRYFLFPLILSSILVNISVYLWIGFLSKFKCILKTWAMILGITIFIISYSIKSEFIFSIFNNKGLKVARYTNKNVIIYNIMIIIQIILLIHWTYNNNGIDKTLKTLDNVGLYKLDSCSHGNENILILIFGIDFILLGLSVILSYRGRFIPDEFNESKKILYTSILSIFLVILCFISINYNTIYIHIFTLPVIVVILLVSNITFIMPKIINIYSIPQINKKVSVEIKNKERSLFSSSSLE